MLAKNICLALLGFSAGITAAGGLFSFIIGLGVISDFADRTHTGEQVMLYEDAVAAGGSLGAVISVYHPAVPFAGCLLPVMGLFGGIFVGCWAMAEPARRTGHWCGPGRLWCTSGAHSFAHIRRRVCVGLVQVGAAPRRCRALAARRAL